MLKSLLTMEKIKFRMKLRTTRKKDGANKLAMWVPVL